MPKAKTTPKKKRSTRKAVPKVEGGCLIPPRVPNAVIKQFAYKRDDAEAEKIAQYVGKRPILAVG
jgi:hypothetical protein